MTVGFPPENPEVKVVRNYTLKVEVPFTGESDEYGTDLDYLEALKAAKESIQDLGEGWAVEYVSERPSPDPTKVVYQFKVW